MKQQLRIIGGQYRGKKLSFPEIEGLRPTPDRVRETLFNWLMHDIRSARCLDAFAGSGALGLEAFSRSAAEVVLIEQSPIVFNHLKKVVATFNDSKLTVIQADTINYLQHTSATFDVIFLDPPFSKNYWEPCIETISKSSILIEQGLLYIESPQEMSLDPTYWKKLKLKQAGQVFYALYQKQAPT